MSTQWKTGSGSFNGLSVESAQFILDIGKFCNWISFFLADGQHLSFWHTCFWLFEFKISDIWQQLSYRTKLRTTGLMALLLGVSLWTWLFFSIKNSQKVLHAQGFRQAHRYYPADDEICPRSERQVPAVSTASPWNQRNSFWISVSSATEYPSFWQMDSICLFGIPVFGFLSSKYRIFDNNWAIEQNFKQLA